MGGLPALISTIEGLFIIQVYLRRQQERGLMQKARRLIEENLRFFSNVLNSLVFCYAWFRKPNFCVQTMSEQYLEVSFVFILVRGEHAQKPKFGDSVKKKTS